MHVVLMLRFASTLPIIGEFVGSGEIVLRHPKLSGQYLPTDHFLINSLSSYVTR